MLKEFRARIIALVLMSLCGVSVLTGCGGGSSAPSNAASSGGSNAGTTSPSNLQSAPSPSLPLYVAGQTLKALDNTGATWSATYSSTAAGTGMFNQQVSYVTSINFAASKGSTIVFSEAVTEFTLMNPYAPLGFSMGFTDLPGRLSVTYVTSYTPLPSKLTVGDSGQLSTGSAGSCCGFTESYSVTADSPTALLLNIHLAFSDFGIDHGEASLTGLYSGASTLTYAVNANGVATLMKIQVNINGADLTFQ
jgi:hypothetical protein